MLKIKNLSKNYEVSYGTINVLDDINLEVTNGDFVMIMGESGSGKSTFINCISTLLKPSSGNIFLNDKDISTLKNKDLEKLRLHEISYIFQENYMVDGLTILENIIVARLQYDENAKDKAIALLDKLNISNIKDKYPHQVSGGERQRAAIARALINDPKILFADEPTASLNPKTAEILMLELQKLNDEGFTIIMVTHSISVASFGKRLLVLSDKQFKVDMKIPVENKHDFIVDTVGPYL
ncbi:MAG: ABC transporter ATP-binding protein [Erysipelothrix sp.]|nr:ABC transporter ATP-binding protein [Erysipelothrix sp.]